jgi:hypothetical protein
MRVALVLAGTLAVSLAGCGPSPVENKGQSAERFELGRKCPDLRLRDKSNPCSPAYLPPKKPPLKRDSL